MNTLQRGCRVKTGRNTKKIQTVLLTELSLFVRNIRNDKITSGLDAVPPVKINYKQTITILLS
jgi:hypothetical protein